MKGMRRIGQATGTLTTEEVNFIEEAIVKTVRPQLVGRMLLPIKPLPHAGFLKQTHYTENDMGQATISMTGEEESQDAVDLSAVETKIPIISKDYTLHWREVLARRNNGEDLNTQHAENAGRQVAEEEDKLILSGEYTGWPSLGIQGFMTRTGRQTRASAGAWPASVHADVSACKQLLRAAGHYGPYRIVMPSTEYTKLEAMIANTEKWYFQSVGELLGGVENILISDNVFPADGTQDGAFVCDIGEGNGELVVGEDLNHYLQQIPSMNYKGKVWEAVTPVIKRPNSVVEITAIT